MQAASFGGAVNSQSVVQFAPNKRIQATPTARLMRALYAPAIAGET